MIMQLLKKTGCWFPLKRLVNRMRGDNSSEVKQGIVIGYGEKNGLKMFVETGTYQGEMVYAARNSFDKIISIELDEKLAASAQSQLKNNSNITIMQGDSAVVLPKVISTIDQPVLFWLDGHYSAGVTARGDKDTPIMEELTSIFSQLKTKFVILIDDAHCFNGTGDYPTMDELKEFVKKLNGDYLLEVTNNIIVINKP